MRKIQALPLSIPDWRGESSPFSSGQKPKFYRPDELKDVGEGKTLRTDFFEKVLVGLYWQLGHPVPYAFVTENGLIRSLDAGCLKFLRNRHNPEIDFECDEGGYISAVQPSRQLVDRYERMRPKILAMVSYDDSASLDVAEHRFLRDFALRAILLHKGFVLSPGRKVSRLDHRHLEHPIYLKTPLTGHIRIRRAIVVHPSLKGELSQVAGIEADTEYYHSSNLREFPERLHGGNAPTNYGIALDAENSQSFDALLNQLIGASHLESQSPLRDVEAAAAQLSGISATERDAIVKARMGQGKFRTDLLNYWCGCAVTGMDFSLLLRASHIKPWRSSDNRERLDPYNGLLLTPNLDTAFDLGLISFDDEGTILLSAQLDHASAKALGVGPGLRLKKLEQPHRVFLKWHREQEFKLK